MIKNETLFLISLGKAGKIRPVKDAAEVKILCLAPFINMCFRYNSPKVL
jgi:hypothetical protein